MQGKNNVRALWRVDLNSGPVLQALDHVVALRLEMVDEFRQPGAAIVQRGHRGNL